MSDYKIKSIGKVDFRTYKDVIRVIAIKQYCVKLTFNRL